MESRESRWRSQGLIIFGFSALLYVLATDTGMKAMKDFVDNPPKDASWVALIGFLVVFFGSETVGLLLNQATLSIICIFFYHTSPGKWYSIEWERNLLHTPIWGFVRKAAQTNDEIKKRLDSYPADVLLSYFWQQAPEKIVIWVSRRHTVYWSFCCTVSAFIVGVFIFGSAIVVTSATVLVIPFVLLTTVAAALSVCLLLHAHTARVEAYLMIELWALHKFGSFLPEITPGLPVELKKLLDTAGKGVDCIYDITDTQNHAVQRGEQQTQ